MTTWDDELFVHSYTWRRPPTSYAFLGNGRLSAFFDFSGIAQPDGFCYRPIRGRGKAAGLFRLFVGPDPDPGSHIYIASGWEQSLNMKYGLLETRRPAMPEGWKRTKITAFIALEENLLVVHWEPCEGSRKLEFGLSFAQRSAAAELGNLKMEGCERKLSASFDVLGSARPADFPSDSPDPYRDVAFKCELALGVLGDGSLHLEGSTPLVRFHGPGDFFLAFDAQVDGKPRAETLLDEALELGYEGTLERQIRAWDQFWGRWLWKVGDPELERLYISSLYYMRSCASEYGVGVAPYGLNAWDSLYFWDETHMHAALISSNQVELAGKVAYVWEKFLDLGRRALKSKYPEAEGVYLDFFRCEREYYRDPPPIPKDKFNASLSYGLSAWRQYSYTGDPKALERSYPILSGIADMLLTYALVPQEGKLLVRKSQQLDEYYKYEGVGNPFGAAAMARALLKAAGKACRILGNGDGERYLQAAERIEIPQDGEVFVVFSGCSRDPASNETILNFFPAMDMIDEEKARRTLDHCERGCMSEQGLCCVAPWTRDTAVFPWVHFRAMMGEAMLKNPEGFGRLLEKGKAHECYVSSWGKLPEYIHRRGWHNLPGFLTAGAMYVLAMNTALLYGEGDAVYLLAAAPPEWLLRPLAFGLRCEPGALVEFETDAESEMRLKVNSSKDLLLRIRKLPQAGELLCGERVLRESGGFWEMEVPKGASEYRLELVR
ncbi:MAG: hypothetical protein DRQ24_08620 [Candidatus Latescibacterota bacterium]|nr:MAG: hypothetical protein DRQ24_08620 [Candidatus Latescibacterota bacterium]